MVAVEGAATIPRWRATGQQKRNSQSRRYRERVKSRKPPEPEAVNDPARVITTRTFFSIIAATGRAATRDSCVRGEVLYSASARHACRRALERIARTGAALETGARLNPEILIRQTALALHSASLMQLEFHQLDRRWEHLRVRHPARQRRLLASLAESPASKRPS